MSNTNSPEVSVVITNYNYAAYLEQAIRSVLAQTYDNLKLYIIDDSSTDNSIDIIKKYSDKATLIKHRKNKGIVFSRNEALDLIGTKYVVFLDADDWFNVDYVEKLVDAAELKHLDVAYCGAQYYVDEEKGMNWIPPVYTLDRLKNENYVHMSSLLRRDAVGDIRFDKSMEGLTHEDWDFFLNLGLKGLKFERIDTTSLNYRFKTVSRNITRADADEKFASLYKYVYEKYSAQYPDEVGYQAYYRFMNSFVDANNKYIAAERLVNEQRTQIAELEDKLNSRAYKVGILIALPFRIVKFSAKKIKRLNPKNIIIRTKAHAIAGDASFNFWSLFGKREGYFLEKQGEFLKTSKFAVVLHLYYMDNWNEIFVKKLKTLKKHLPIDIYVTMPASNKKHIEIIKDAFADANILITPNRGRDVLPFLKTSALLRDMGYVKVLKIHSKRSLHRNHDLNTAENGDAWLINTLNALIPDSVKLFEEVTEKLNDKHVGMIGALQYYYPIKMYLKNNRVLIERILKRLRSDIFKGQVSRTLNSYGYFGGTMFWVDLASISPLGSISKHSFQEERGQNDGTIAHALERIFCLLPQLSNKKVYGISPTKLVEIDEASSGFPKWYYDDISGGKPPISIVVPVYSDWPSLSKNMHSLKKTIGNSEDISVHYVNDSGPEADILEEKILKNISGLTNFFYYRNEKNLGFVQTCNKATLELTNKSDDILLLNSDTKVTKNFVFEMRTVLYSQGNIGAVTSRSNNATIWSVPMTSKLANYRPLSYLLYRIIKRGLPGRYISPTIHGFCVLIRREVIQRYGLFDEIYGRGYGEENDFAMRLRANGWLCAVANYSFVFHYESRSFGNKARNEQIEKNEKILIKRYPEYRQLVQEYWDRIKEPLK